MTLHTMSIHTRQERISRGTVPPKAGIAVGGSLGCTLRAHLSAIGFTHEKLDPPIGRTGQFDILFVDAEALQHFYEARQPLVFVCHGGWVRDRTLRKLLGRNISFIDEEQIDEHAIRDSIFKAILQGQLPDLRRYLLKSRPAPRDAHRLLELFLTWPRRMSSVRDIGRALAISKKRARLLVKALGFRRAEHLFTYWRSELWIWLVHRGVKREACEHFLGVRDRGNFRRACIRAHVEIPWLYATHPNQISNLR